MSRDYTEDKLLNEAFTLVYHDKPIPLDLATELLAAGLDLNYVHSEQGMSDYLGYQRETGTRLVPIH